MKKVKERCLWFVGMGRLIGSGYKSFMYCENDIVLINFDSRMNIVSSGSKPQVGIPYTLAKTGLK